MDKFYIFVHCLFSKEGGLRGLSNKWDREKNYDHTKEPQDQDLSKADDIDYNRRTRPVTHAVCSFI